MKIIVTTSKNYLHLVPVFDYLFKKNFSGYTYELFKSELPANEWSNDLRKLFTKQPDHFIWLMEDTFIKSVNFKLLEQAIYHIEDNPIIGKFCLTNESMRREHTNQGDMFRVSQTARYRLSTQPAIWSRRFALEYLHNGQSPWDFETQDPFNDGFRITGFTENVIEHNEGVRKYDVNNLNLSGFDENDTRIIKSLV